MAEADGMAEARRLTLHDVQGSAVGVLDPRTRLLAALAIAVTLIGIKSLPGLLIALALSFALVLLSGLSLRALLHRLLHVEGFMLVLLLILPFTVEGHPLFTLGPLTASSEGLTHAVALVLRINVAILAIFALLGSLEPVRLGQAMARLGVPLQLVHLFLFTVRYVGLFRAETGRLLDSMRARAFVPRSNWHSWRTFGTLAGMILVRSMDRATRVGEAMRARAYCGRLPLSDHGSFSAKDAIFALLLAVVLAGLVVADRIL